MKKLFITLISFLAVLNGWAWSQKGHDVVASIAERHLTEAAADSVKDIFDGMSLVYWANWLDNASHTPDYSYTKTWHYKNIDAGMDYDSVPAFHKGDVVTATREQIAILGDSASTRSQKQLALKILVHVLGDMHQPMHMGHASDRGGNQVQVRFFDRGTNLHSVWDGSMVNSAHSWTFSEWTEQLDRLSPESEAAETQGNVDDWARQTYGIATEVYNYFPAGTKISYNHIAYWAPTIERQLLRGGLRLAAVLNAIYDPESGTDASQF